MRTVNLLGLAWGTVIMHVLIELPDCGGAYFLAGGYRQVFPDRHNLLDCKEIQDAVLVQLPT
eukprot:387765-Pyramimonas_sp.AAC.1